jgi:hypothetical protein
MADSIQATPRSAWIGAIADALANIKQRAGSVPPQMDIYGAAGALHAMLGSIPEGLNRLSYGESMSAPPQETGPDPSLAAKYAPQMDLAGVFPAGKSLAAVKGIGAALAKTGLLGTMFDRSHLIQLAKTNPELVAQLEKARSASREATAAGATPGEAWKAGSQHLEGTDFAGWRPATDEYPEMFEGTNVHARLSPRFDPTGSSLVPAQQNVVGKVTQKEGKLGEVYQDPVVKQFYPGMDRWDVKATMGPAEAATGEGSLTYNPTMGTWAGIPPKIEASASSPNILRSTFGHEVGHAVALDSNLPRGSNFDKERTLLELKYPHMPPDELDYRAAVNYHNNPGEKMARVIENRRFMTAADMRATSPEFEFAGQHIENKLPAPENSWWYDMPTHEEQKAHLLDKGLMTQEEIDHAYRPRGQPEPAIQQFTGLPEKAPFAPGSEPPSPLAQLLLQGLGQ